jgi:hypothetical protein
MIEVLFKDLPLNAQFFVRNRVSGEWAMQVYVKVKPFAFKSWNSVNSFTLNNGKKGYWFFHPSDLIGIQE